MRPDAIREQLSRILASTLFARAGVHRRMLAFLVEQTLAGEGESLTESYLAARLFGRDPSDLTRDTSIVRVQAGKLRKRLTTYYETEGVGDTVVVTIPRGGYVPHFDERGMVRAWAFARADPRAWVALAVLLAAGLAGGSRGPWSETVTWRESVNFSREISPDERARRLYAQGREQWTRTSLEGFEQSLALYAKALRYQPRSAETWAAVADSYHLMGAFRMLPKEQALEMGAAAVERALELDERCAAAYAARAFAQMRLDHSRPDPEPTYRRALALDPDSDTAHLWYSTLLSRRGRHSEAIWHAQRAVSLNPTSEAHYTGLGKAYFFAREPLSAIEPLKTALRLNPEHLEASTRLAYAYMDTGQHGVATAQIENAIKQRGRKVSLLLALAKLNARAGRRREARTLQAEIEAAKPASRFERAVVALDIGQHDRAFDVLNELADSGRFPLVGLLSNPLMDPFRQDPRFQRLVWRVYREHPPSSPL